MKNGETKRFNCDECSTEFEITLEPKAKGESPSAKEGRKNMDDNEVIACPFCANSVDEDDTADADE